MKANELRIGNWIKYEDKLVQVVQLSSLMILCQRDENQFLVNCAPKVFQPIELTEEVLLKIGFKNCNARYVDIYKIEKWIDEFNFISIDYRDLRNSNTTLNITHINDETYNQCTLLKNNIKYLHQLQNAYYCLTNQEMEVNL